MLVQLITGTLLRCQLVDALVLIARQHTTGSGFRVSKPTCGGV